MFDVSLETTEPLVAADAQVIDDGLDQFNHAADLSGVTPFTSVARLGDGRIIGGAIARRWGACCEIQQMWVDDSMRSHGIGGQIMEQVEAHARAHGCTVLYLDTFSFPAPEFYKKHGYEVACRFDRFPDGVSKFIMRKSLL